MGRGEYVATVFEIDLISTNKAIVVVVRYVHRCCYVRMYLGPTSTTVLVVWFSDTAEVENPIQIASTILSTDSQALEIR